MTELNIGCRYCSIGFVTLDSEDVVMCYCNIEKMEKMHKRIEELEDKIKKIEIYMKAPK